MTGFDLSTATNITIGGTQASAVYLGNNLIWPTNHDYSQDYLTIETIDSGSFTFDYGHRTTGLVSYSIDNGATWNTLSANTSTPIIQAGDKILWKAQYAGASDYIGKFVSTGRFNVNGNIMSLLYGDNFIGQTTLTELQIFYGLFSGSNIVSANNFILPATTLSQACYSYMFYSCTSLVDAPALPATSLIASDCYSHMFYGCTSLVNAPALPATTLSSLCYSHMFYGCTSLVNAPALPATTLVSNCYVSMFKNCSSLVVAPELPATNLVWYCYDSMFANCERLNYVKMMALDIIEPGVPGVSGDAPCTTDMLDNVAASGTFVKNINATWNNEDLVPSGWTVQTASS